MKFWKPILWDEFEQGDHLLYFAHRCQEMLFHYTNEKFKVPLLNTHLLAREYCNFKTMVRENEVQTMHGKVILQEFKDSLIHDVVIKQKLGQVYIDHFAKKIDINDDISTEKYMYFFYDKLNVEKYYNWVVVALRNNIEEQKRKDELEKIIRIFITELVGLGYSYKSIYYRVHKYFFKNRVYGIQSLNEFIDSFDFKKRNYDVYISAKKSVLQFKDILKRRMKVEFDDDGFFSRFKIKHSKIILLFKDISALDSNSAYETVLNRMQLIHDFNMFLTNREKIKLEKGAMVHNLESDEFAFLELEDGKFRVLCEKIDNELELTDILITQLVKKYNASEQSDLLKIMKMLQLHNTSLRVDDARSAFLNLWSIFEVLISQSTGKDLIEKINSYLSVILRRDYIEDILNYHDQLIKENIGNEYIDIIDKIEVGDEDIGVFESVFKFAKLAFQEQNDELRSDLYSKLSDYPVLRHRIAQLETKYCTLKKINPRIEKYLERIRWHLYRLYRARNLIIHSGEEPDWLYEIGAHLHSYIDVAMLATLTEIATSESISLIDNAILNQKLASEISKKNLIEKNHFSDEVIYSLFKN